MKIFGGKEGKPEGFLYVCTTTCTFNGKFYREGETIVLPEKKEVPHFEFVEEVKISDK